MPIWYRKNGGIWNADPTADPATNTGGISMHRTINQKMYPTCLVSGDGNLLHNFGASAFAYTPPAGFTHGFPKEDGSGWTTFDPAKLNGNAFLFDGNLRVNSGSGFGGCQTVDGATRGQYYFEYQNVHNTFFNVISGTGMGREYPGMDYSFFQDGRYAPSDDNGGVRLYLLGAISIFPASILAYGTTAISHIFSNIGNGDVISIAVIVENSSMTMADVQVEEEVTLDAPFVTMRYSDNGGRNWSNPRIQPLGDLGTNQTVQFRNMGQARNKLIEVSWSGSFKNSLGGATIITQVSNT